MAAGHSRRGGVAAGARGQRRRTGEERERARVPVRSNAASREPSRARWRPATARGARADSPDRTERQEDAGGRRRGHRAGGPMSPPAGAHALAIAPPHACAEHVRSTCGACADDQ
eukprot:1594347-Pleurochrysis_carterae.AAC.2